ncbi:MAG: hypothetical protein U0350_30450 [Caldilineaceae bacterium]
MLPTKRYSTHIRYQFLALVCLLLAVGFGWNLTRSLTLDTAFFFVLSLGLIAWAVYAMFSHVEVNEDELALVTPLRAPHRVDFRQLISVSENGRFNPVLTLLYHPRRSDGLLDLDDAQSLILPAVTAQQELLDLLEARLPR